MASSNRGPRQSNLRDPTLKTWGSRRLLRCIRAPEIRLLGSLDDAGVPLLRKSAILNKDRTEQNQADVVQDNPPMIQHPPPPPPPPPDVTWSIRTRRGTYMRPLEILQNDLNTFHLPPPTRLIPRRSEDFEELQKQGRKSLSIALSREEIDEDFYTLTGRRASRRPKKRSRSLKSQLDLLFPGFFLSEVTACAYEVVMPEGPPPESEPVSSPAVTT